MIPKNCKRLAEVDFPIAEVSRHAAREKSIRHGHPSTLHLWWARRPLASSRAVLLALLWPDPCDTLCPALFKTEARKRLREVGGCNPGSSDEDLRRALLKFIADFANWDNSAKPVYLDVSRALVKAAYAPEDGGAYEPPLVVDPFAGGGSIPLEALRVGCDTFASDLNPVACLILKVMLEDIPRHGPELAEELRRAGAEIKRKAEKELADLYPKDPDGATPIAFLWARTVTCESPHCGAEIPIYRSPWLCKTGATKARYFKEASNGRVYALLVTEHPTGGPVQFRIARGHGSERARPGFAELTGTKAKGNTPSVVCSCCGTVLPGSRANPRVRAQLFAQRGGTDVIYDANGQRTGGARMLAVVTLKPGERGRHFRLPTERDYEAARNAHVRLAKLLSDWEQGGKQGQCPVPSEPTPTGGGSGAGRAFSVHRYGMMNWGDLFTARQKVALIVLSRLVADAEVSERVRRPLACAFDVFARACNSNARMRPDSSVAPAFGMQTLPVTWTFPETVLSGGRTEHFDGAVATVADAILTIANARTEKGQVEQADSRAFPLADESAALWFTDPPYYDAVPYSDLSDFFYVWLKRCVPRDFVLGETVDGTNVLTPKHGEIVQDETKTEAGSTKDRTWFERSMASAFFEGHRVLSRTGMGSVVFAHKTTEGWEALLTGLIGGGWTVTGSWPLSTEAAGRLRARESAALATSVHLICRPRPEDAGVGDWADVLRELPNRVADWMERLQHEGVRGADLVFACIGPALEIFSRYTKVETAEGREVKLDEYLAKVWEVVGRAALAQVLGTAEAKARNGSAGAVEEDARLTALFLWTLQATNGEVAPDAGTEEEAEDAADDEEEEGSSDSKGKGFALVFDVVRRFAQPLGIELSKWEGRVIDTKKGVVRLLPVAERAKQLFGEEGAGAIATRLEQAAAPGTNPLQGMLFPEVEATPKVHGGRGRSRRAAAGGVSDESLAAAREATTLDRVHAAMLLQSSGRTNALRALLKAEQDRGSDFLRLANALSALYPKGSEEKRLLDAMLLAVPR